MKKILFLLVALSGFAFGADAEVLKTGSVIAAGFCLGVAALGGAIAMGNAAVATISGIARNPGVGNKLTTTMFITLAMIEAQVIYALVITLIILYANPFLG